MRPEHLFGQRAPAGVGHGGHQKVAVHAGHQDHHREPPVIGQGGDMARVEDDLLGPGIDEAVAGVVDHEHPGVVDFIVDLCAEGVPGCVVEIALYDAVVRRDIRER